MSDNYKIKPEGADEKPRCALRQMRGGFGFCGGARNCGECPLAKTHEASQYRIDEGDTVQTASSGACRVESFETRHGFRTGFLLVTPQCGNTRRVMLSAVTLTHKKEATALAA